MSDARHDAVIIGAGISGLVCALTLRRGGMDALVLEADLRVGGRMKTDDTDGFLFEHGPFSVVVRDDAFVSLLNELSDDLLTENASGAATKRFILRDGRLVCAPMGPLGLFTTPLLSVRGRARLIRGLILSRRACSEDQSVAEVATRRFGVEFSETFADAVVAGVYGGDKRKLSMRCGFPRLWNLDVRVRSPLLAALRTAIRRSSASNGRNGPRTTVSFSGGLGALPMALASRLGERVVTGAEVQRLGRERSEWVVHYRDRSGAARRVRCRRVFIATEKDHASRLIRAHIPQAAVLLDQIRAAGLVSLNLGFRGDDIGRPLDGYGFLVPSCEKECPLLGALWADSVFPTSAPAGHRLVRVLMGGDRRPELMDEPDDTLVKRAVSALRGPLALRGDPMLVNIRRHWRAIPQPAPGQRSTVVRLRQLLDETPGLTLIGNYLGGASVNDCVREAVCAARRALRPDAREPSRPTCMTDTLETAAVPALRPDARTHA